MLYYWYYLYHGSPEQKCFSCSKLLREGDTCLKFLKKETLNIEDLNFDLHDEEELVAWYMCEECGNQFYSDNLPDLLKKN